MRRLLGELGKGRGGKDKGEKMRSMVKMIPSEKAKKTLVLLKKAKSADRLLKQKKNSLKTLE